MPALHPKTILLVEDDLLIALAEKRALEKYEYAVLHESTGEAAVATVNSVPEIDLILMDINLGSGIDGTEAAELILANHALPIVFVSSHSEREIVEKTERITSYGYVVKNSSITVLDASIKMAFKLFDEKKRSKSIQTKLEATLDAIPDLMFVVDAEGYFRDFHTKSGATSLAMDTDSIVGSHLHDIFPPEEVAAQLALYHACIETGSIQSHSYILEIDGKKSYFDLQLSRLDAEQVLAIIHDVTRQKQIELEKQEIAERLSFACESGGIGIWDYDITDKRLRWDKQVYELFGCRQESYASAAEAWTAIVHPDDKERTERALAVALQREQDYNDMFRIVWADGTIHDVHSIAKIQRDARGVARSFIGINYEITDSKNIERLLQTKNEELEVVNEELRSTTDTLMKQNKKVLVVKNKLQVSEQRLEFVLQGAQLGYWDWDLRTNQILRNEYWATMLGYKLSEIHDTFNQGVELQHPDDREDSWKSIQDHLEGRTDSYRRTYRLKMKDGSYKWILDTGKIMERDEGGKPVRICGTHTDIDEQKKADEKIRHLLAEKEIVLKEVHHRIKNNMSTMRSLLTLQAGNNKDPLAREALDDAGKRMRSMECLYDKLYRADNFSLLSTSAYLPLLIDEIIANFPESRRVSVVKHIQDFVLDAKRLQPLGILINELLTNSMKYAFTGRESGEVSVTAELFDDMISVSVKDNGNGIPESISLDDSTGFGFQLVQALACQLQGKVRLERGAGTKVVLEFRK